MEALWSLEDKLKVSTKGAFVFFALTAFAVVGLCAATFAARKMTRQENRIAVDPELSGDVQSEPLGVQRSQPRPSCGALMSSARWSRGSKWEGGSIRGIRSWKERKTMPLALLACGGWRASRDTAGWRSHNSTSPVWQRPILMGGKCELPKFSGLILYDERGHPLFPNEAAHQEEKPAVVRTTLKDYL